MNVDNRMTGLIRGAAKAVPAGMANRDVSDDARPRGSAASRPDSFASYSSTAAARSTTSSSKAIDIDVAIAKLNKIAEEQKKDVSFSIDKDAHTTVIKVFKSQTGELIKQFPPDEILAMKARVRDSVGLLLDSKM